MIPDYSKVFGHREGMIVRTLLEERPKWVVLLLQLRKSGSMTLSEARVSANISYKSLKTALRYLGGSSTGRGDCSSVLPAVTPLGVEPVLQVIRVPGNKKYITLTDYGERLVSRILEYLREVAIRLGRVDVESEYGIPRVVLLNELAIKFPGADETKLVERLVSFDSVVVQLARLKPSLLAVMRPELVDAVPVVLEIATDRRTTKRVILHLLL